MHFGWLRDACHFYIVTVLKDKRFVQNEGVKLA